MKVEPVRPNSIVFRKTIKDPHGKLKRLLEAIILSGSGFALGYCLCKLKQDKFEKRC